MKRLFKFWVPTVVLCLFSSISIAAVHQGYEAAKGVSTYCPAAGEVADTWSFYTCNCTSFDTYTLNEQFKNEFNGVIFHPFRNDYMFTELSTDDRALVLAHIEGVSKEAKWGNAGRWGPIAKALGIPVYTEPKNGLVAWWDYTKYAGTGHVGIAAEIGTNPNTGNPGVRFKEYNFIPSLEYSQERWVDLDSEEAPSGYIDILAYERDRVTINRKNHPELMFYDQACYATQRDPRVEQFRQGNGGLMKTRSVIGLYDDEIWVYGPMCVPEKSPSLHELFAVNDHALVVGGYGGGGGTGGTTSPPKQGDANVKEVQGAIQGTDNFQGELIVAPGTEIIVRVKGKNEGKGRINNMEVKYYRTKSGQKVFDRDPNRYLGDDDGVDVEPGEKFTEQKQHIQVPSEQGTYYYYVYCKNEGDENPANNTSRDDDPPEYLKVVVAAPDMKIQSAWLSAATGYVGDTMSASMVSINPGVDAPTNLTVGWFLDGMLIATDNIKPENFKRGASKSEDVVFQAPMTPGVHTLSAQLDYGNKVPEANESDNWVNLTFTVNPRSTPPPPKNIWVVNPSPGAVWRHDREYKINWGSSNVPAGCTIKIEYSLDGGASWSVYDWGAVNDGQRRITFSWVKKDSRNAMIRVSVNEFPGVTGVSQYFMVDHKK